MVHQLRLCAFTAKGVDLIPSGETKILQAKGCGQKEKEFSIGFETCWSFSLLSGPSSKWNILWFFLQNNLYKYSISFDIQELHHLKSKHFLQDLAEICTTGSCTTGDAKCPPSSADRGCVAMLHLQSISAKFLDSTSAVILSVKTSCWKAFTQFPRIFLSEIFFVFTKTNHFLDHYPELLSFHLQDYLTPAPFWCDKNSMLWSHSVFSFFLRETKISDRIPSVQIPSQFLQDTFPKINRKIFDVFFWGTAFCNRKKFMNFTIIFKSCKG